MSISLLLRQSAGVTIWDNGTLVPFPPRVESLLEGISPLIKSQVPDFVNADHPNFVAFLEAYYESKLEELVNLSVRGYNKTPLMYAINQKVDIEIIHQLINAGADVNDGDGTTTIITPLGELLSNVMPTSSTGKPRDIQYTAEVFVLLLDSGVDVTQQSDDKTPLELASTFLTDDPVKGLVAVNAARATIEWSIFKSFGRWVITISGLNF